MTKYDEWWLADYFRKSRDSQKAIYEEHLEFLREKYKLLREQHEKAVEALRVSAQSVRLGIGEFSPDSAEAALILYNYIKAVLAAIDEPTDA